MTRLTLEDVEERLKQIKEKGIHDDEEAHIAEDVLHQEVLQHISEKFPEQEWGKLAALALTSLDLEFARWCA